MMPLDRQPKSITEQTGLDAPLIGIGLFVGAFLALVVAARTTDPLMQAHAFVFLAAFVASGFALI